MKICIHFANFFWSLRSTVDQRTQNGFCTIQISNHLHFKWIYLYLLLRAYRRERLSSRTHVLPMLVWLDFPHVKCDIDGKFRWFPTVGVCMFFTKNKKTLKKNFRRCQFYWIEYSFRFECGKFWHFDGSTEHFYASTQ